MKYCGAHISTINGDIIKSIKEIEKYGGNMCQIFVTKHLHRNVTKITTEKLKEINKYIKKNKFKLVIHSSYMLNFAKIPILHNNDNKKKISWWVINLINEMKYASLMGAIGCVIHLGKHLDLTKKMALDNMLQSFTYVINNTPTNVLLIIETSSGQGTELCFKLENLQKFYNMFSTKLKKRIGFCIDSCHIFAAGYDITTKNNITKYFNKFDKLIGINKISLIHLNDSKKKLNSRVDRHEAIGKGKIGLNGLTHFVKYCFTLNLPIILETPKQNYKIEINLIKNMN